MNDLINKILAQAKSYLAQKITEIQVNQGNWIVYLFFVSSQYKIIAATINKTF